MYKLLATSRYKKDVKIAKKRGLDLDDLDFVIRQLVQGLALPPKYYDHQLCGNYAGCRECHIHPDWLLIYETEEELKLLTLVRTGTHSDLF